MDQRVSKTAHDGEPLVTRELKWWTWKRGLVATVVVLVVLEIGTYAFNWTWTGFQDHGNLWDWLSLLLVPVIVAGLPIWYSIYQSRGDDEARQHGIG
jgi:hypothetical protein